MSSRVSPPSVALESAVISHGLPRPVNVKTALYLEELIRSQEAVPHTIGVIQGKIISRLREEDISLLGTSADVVKASCRDLPTVVARQQNAGTTVAATIWIARKSAIEVFATGGIGGVHRQLSNEPLDVSADLEELARTPITVVCAGAKAILDLPATLEYLETKGVMIIGYQTDEFPAFYSRSSGLPVQVRCDSPDEIARIAKSRSSLGLPGALLVCAPIPVEAEIPREVIDPLIGRALKEAARQRVRAGDVTPFLLNRLSELSDGRTLRANVALLENNALVAARIACALETPAPLIA